MARAKRKKHTGSSAGKNRGGRKPGKWELLKPEEILAYRQENGLSRAKLAGILKVSTTSIQNWETGRVASRKIQERLRALIDGRPLPRSGRSMRAARRNPDTTDTAISTTGSIVSAYLRTQKGMKPDQLTQLVRSVKRALTS